MEIDQDTYIKAVKIAFPYLKSRKVSFKEARKPEGPLHWDARKKTIKLLSDCNFHPDILDALLNASREECEAIRSEKPQPYTKETHTEWWA